MATDERYTVVYDGTCRVCTRIARGLRERGRTTLEVVSSQTPGVRERFPWIDSEAYDESLQLIGPGNETWQGAAAVERILGVLPHGRLIAWIFKVPFVRQIADRFYRWFARNRYRLGCSQHCKI